MVKPPKVKPGSLDEFGFENMTKGNNERNCLKSLIKFGVPCIVHNAHYLKHWKNNFMDSESYLVNR